MLDLILLKNKYQEIQSVDKLNKDYLLRLYFDFLFQIDKKKINVEQSKFLHINDGYKIILISKGDSSCTIYFEILNETVVDIQLNKGGEFLPLQPISDLSDVYKLRRALSDLFQSVIKEELFIVENKIKRVKYTVYLNNVNASSSQEYISSYGVIFPWQKKVIESKIYGAWLSTD